MEFIASIEVTKDGYKSGGSRNFSFDFYEQPPTSNNWADKYVFGSQVT